MDCLALEARFSSELMSAMPNSLRVTRSFPFQPAASTHTVRAPAARVETTRAHARENMTAPVLVTGAGRAGTGV